MAGEQSNDAVLSDVEEEDDQSPPTLFNTTVTVDSFRQLLSDLNREKKARQQSENSNSELQTAFNRLKILAHESIQKRNELTKSNDQLSSQVAELVKQLDESVRVKDLAKSDIETAANMLVTGIDKISGKVSIYKNFIATGLPRSEKYTGLSAVCYGVVTRANEIVEELLKQMEVVSKDRNEARELIENRNYEIAIQVSHLESSISGLKDEVEKKDSVVESLENSFVEKDRRIRDLETEVVEKQLLVDDHGLKLKNLESRIDSQRPLLVYQLNIVSKLHEQLCSVVKIVDVDDGDDDKKNQLDLTDSLFLPQELDVEENIRACLAGLESVSELSSIVHQKSKDLVVDRNRELKSLNESVIQLVKEKEHIGSLLKSSLARRMSTDMSSKTNELFRVMESGLREAGLNYKFSNHTGDKNAGNLDSKDDEIYTLAGALEGIIKQSQLEIIELKHTVDELREETRILKEDAEAQAKELIQRREQVEELKEKEREANDNVEGLMIDVAAAEEEISRWKAAAQQEAEAGSAIEQDYVAQLTTVYQELEEAKQGVLESEKKLKFKEETATAAMAARDAAEKSLRLADSRATRLRERVEELTRQLEQLDARESQSSQSGVRYVCWPWQWLGLNIVGSHPPRLDSQPRRSNETELSEPLI